RRVRRDAETPTSSRRARQRSTRRLAAHGTRSRSAWGAHLSPGNEASGEARGTGAPLAARDAVAQTCFRRGVGALPEVTAHLLRGRRGTQLQGKGRWNGSLDAD